MSHPNILFLFPDQHRPDWLGTNAELQLRTPTLDDLSKRGVRFTNAVCPSALCVPSRSCLAAGVDYHRCPAPANDHDFPLDHPTYYKMLRDSGYHVAGVGKFDLQKHSAQHALDGRALLNEWGFSDGCDIKGKWGVILEPEGQPLDAYTLYLEEHGLLNAHLADFARRQGQPRRGYTMTDPSPLPDHAYSDTWVAQKAVDLLRDFPTEHPWHLMVNFTGPHDPMDVTQPMYDRWRDVTFPLPHDSTEFDLETHQDIRRNYAAMIENIDMQIGRIINAVGERGELENTLVVYASDHGEMLGDHNHWAKALWYQQSMGIPLIVAGPGVQQNKVLDTPVSLIDLAATFLDVGGLPISDTMDARSLVPVLTGKTDQHREVVMSAYSHGGQHWPRRWYAIYDGRYKLVVFDDDETPSYLLYDLRNDPNEDHDIAADHPDRVVCLKSALSQMRKSHD